MKIKNYLYTVLALILILVPPLANAEDGYKGEQYFPALVYRTGPYAAAGSGFWGGFEDYLTLINLRDGGVNGIKLVWEECETAYNVDRGLECYERLKFRNGQKASLIHPLNTGLTYRLIERVTEDQIPLVTMGYGRTDASDGRIFPYVFPLMVNYWSLSTAKIRFIGSQVGGMEKLKGLKIANIYHDGGYGRETKPVLEKQAAKYGFTLRHFPVAHPGLDQKATWLEIGRRYKPDWVILRGWGIMNAVALKGAKRVRFPVNKIVGNWWSGAEEDVIPAGKAAVGYIASGFHPSGKEFPVIQEIIENVHGVAAGNISAQRIGTVYYNRGVIAAMVTVEAMRQGQKRFGNIALNGEQMRWAIENLKIDMATIESIGAKDLLAPLAVSCADHEGNGSVRFQRWNGDAWEPVGDWVKTDQQMVRPMIEASARKYAQEKGISIRTGESLGSQCS